ncbi:MAG: hypothetical protein IPM98_14175 [Lewinellaceae bacterium]|nr:hypothetical protein [Lewinellaceae bacterium]
MLLNHYRTIVLPLVLLLLAAPFSADAITKTWNGTSGNWSDGSKWIPVGVPTSTDEVVINNGTVTLDVAPTVAGFTMSGGAIEGTSNLLVTGNLTQSGGNLGNFGDITVGGILLWSGGTVGNAAATATGSVFVAGAATFSGGGSKSLWKKTLQLNGGGSWTAGTITIGFGGILRVASGQTFTANNAASPSLSIGGVPGTFEIAGTLQKLGAGVLTVNAPVNHSGTIQAQAGI